MRNACEPAMRCYVRVMATQTDTRELITQAALAYIDEHGVDALTLRALGQSVGMHHTAIYRHFASRDEVLAAALGLVVQSAVDQAGPLPADPRERLLVLFRGIRGALHEHPAVSVVFLLPSITIADSPAATAYVEEIMRALTDAGLRGSSLLLHYRILEGFTLGTTAFDYSGAPEHLESRRQRYRTYVDPAFEAATRDVQGIDDLNEAAFDRGLVVLVDACIAAGR